MLESVELQQLEYQNKKPNTFVSEQANSVSSDVDSETHNAHSTLFQRVFGHKNEKAVLSEQQADSDHNDGGEKPTKHGWLRRVMGDGNTEVSKNLQPRHITFLALGGTIGTGVFFSTGGTVAIAGPGGALVIYGITAIFVLAVVLCLCEMVSYIPATGAFQHYAKRFLDESFGFALGINYYLQWAFSIPSEVAAANFVISFWADNAHRHIPQWVWCFVIIFPVFFLQLLNVRAYGEVEYWAALVKVILIVVFIIVGLLFNWGGVPTASAPSPGLNNFRHGWAFIGGFGGLFSEGYAFYSFGGTELVALTSGETKKPWKAIPKATRGTVARIVIFMLMVVLVIGLNIPYNDPRLVNAMNTNNVAESPVTIIFEMAGFHQAKHLINAILLVAILSSINSCYYASSRMLMALAKDRMLPPIFGWTTRSGVPLFSELVTLAISGLTFLTTIWGNGVVFSWFQNITSASAVLTWMMIGVISVRFHMALKAQGVPKSDLPMTQWLFPLLPICCVGIGAFLLAGMGYSSCQGTYGVDWTWRDPFGTFLGIGVFIVCYVFWKIWHWRTDKFRPAIELDLHTGRAWPIGEGQHVMIADNEKHFLKRYNNRNGSLREKIRWYWYCFSSPLELRKQLKKVRSKDSEKGQDDIFQAGSLEAESQVEPVSQPDSESETELVVEPEYKPKS